MKYNTGRVVDFDVLLMDKENAAKELSEGSSSLEKLLLLCFDNNIRTISSCAHENMIVFELNDDNFGFHLRLKQILMDKYGFKIILGLSEHNGRITYDIHGDDERVFDWLYDGISTALQDKQNTNVYYDIECAYALLNKTKDIHIDMPTEEDVTFFIQSHNKKAELEDYLFSDNYYGNNLYVLNRTDIQNVLYKLYQDAGSINEKKGFLSRFLETILPNQKSK